MPQTTGPTQPPSPQHPRRPKSSARIAPPVAHLLALAPLDVWVKMLATGPKRSRGIHPRYWLRLAGIGLTSLVGTMCSTPERFILWITRSLTKTNKEHFSHPPGVLVILGYYRSGTTHAHNLISCDPNTVTPRWYQALLGQGFVLSWTITRFLLVPFLGSSRPQDGVGFGPLWPAEDDFALAGWGRCSTLPARLIFPSRWEHWNKWNTLEECSQVELSRWRKTVANFAWKVTRRHPNRMLVLKTPSHGAHIEQLKIIFGENIRFLHIARDPIKVIESNLRMHDALSSHLLEEPLDPTQLRARIVDEYLQIERATRDQAQALPDGHIAYLAHEDIIADPLGQLRTAFQSIGLDISQAHEQAMNQYLSDLGSYSRPAHHDIDLGIPSDSEPQAIEELQTLCPATSQPRAETVPLSTTSKPPQPSRTARGIFTAIMTTLLLGAIWIGLIWIIKQAWPEYRPRLDQFVWIGGSIIGLLAFKAAGTGSKALGIICALLTILIFISVSFPITVINWNFAADGTTEQFIYHNKKGAIHGLTAPSSFIYALFGLLTAYRHASTTGPTPPGT